MAHQYGPWATAINVGRNPQLSAFWQRRLTMLMPTSQTSPVLSRRQVLWLGMAVLLTLTLPTFRSAPVAADENKSATQPEKTSSDDRATAKTHPNSHPVSEIGIYTTWGEDSGYLFLPAYIHSGLCYLPTWRELNITRDQEKKLREISANALKVAQGLAPRNEETDRDADTGRASRQTTRIADAVGGTVSGRPRKLSKC